jgi:hypothetical protein
MGNRSAAGTRCNDRPRSIQTDQELLRPARRNYIEPQSSCYLSLCCKVLRNFKLRHRRAADVLAGSTRAPAWRVAFCLVATSCATRKVSDGSPRARSDASIQVVADRQHTCPARRESDACMPYPAVGPCQLVCCRQTVARRLNCSASSGTHGWAFARGR